MFPKNLGLDIEWVLLSAMNIGKILHIKSNRASCSTLLEENN